jgi:hypothetical protein
MCPAYASRLSVKSQTTHESNDADFQRVQSYMLEYSNEDVDHVAEFWKKLQLSGAIL